MTDNRAYQGFETDSSGNSEYNRLSFVFQQLMGRTATTTLVQIIAVHQSGELAPVGLVDVQPMVAQLDGSGNTTDHAQVFNVPYMRLQGGANAVIIDPAVGDIGICLFASHDISTVKTTKKKGPPGSRRRFHMSDALYIGGVLNAVPTQYIRFSADGIELKPAAGKPVTITGKLEVTDSIHTPGTITGDTDVIAGGKSGKTHTHGGVTTGGGNSLGPN